MDRNCLIVYPKYHVCGQARKSLWIETRLNTSDSATVGGQARKSLWIETMKLTASSDISSVRLVRACGSKRTTPIAVTKQDIGQARKSLWIETVEISSAKRMQAGQARKSLWIETIGVIVCSGQAFL